MIHNITRLIFIYYYFSLVVSSAIAAKYNFIFTCVTKLYHIIMNIENVIIRERPYVYVASKEIKGNN